MKITIVMYDIHNSEKLIKKIDYPSMKDANWSRDLRKEKYPDTFEVIERTTNKQLEAL